MRLLTSTEPLDSSSFYSLYLGGLAFESERRRLKSCYVLLMTGRLGLRPTELRHLHDGWIDWEREALVIPDRDPCACRACLDRARHRQRRGDGRSLESILAAECWSPPTEMGARCLPFGWARRLSSVLGTFLSETAYLDASVEQLQKLVTDAAANANTLDPDGVDLAAIRGSAASFLADAGFDAPRLADCLGVQADVAAKFTRRKGGEARDRLYAACDESVPALCGDDPDYPLVCDPSTFDREPFDPASAHDQCRRRAEQRDGQLLSNPRPDETPEDVPFDPGDGATPKYLDANSDVIQTDEEGRPVRTIADWVDREYHSAPGGSAARDSTDSDHGGIGSASTNSESASHSQEGLSDARSDADAAVAETNQGVTQGSVLDPRETLTKPVVADVSTTFACGAVADGSPVSGRVMLGQEELVLHQDELESPHVVELAQISEVALDYSPSGLEDVFDSSLGVVYRTEGNRCVTVLELPGKKQLDFSTKLFKRRLNATPVVVTHPAREGGRVTDERPEDLLLYVRSRKMEFGPDEETTVFGIRLSDVVHVERGNQTREGTSYRGLWVRHLRPDGRALTTAIAPREEEDLSILERYVMRNYRERKERAQNLDLSAEQKEILVALYSTGGGTDLTMIMDKDSEELSTLLASLKKADLVRIGSDGAKLTGMGQMIVSDTVDDVNV